MNREPSAVSRAPCALRYGSGYDGQGCAAVKTLDRAGIESRLSPSRRMRRQRGLTVDGVGMGGWSEAKYGKDGLEHY